jgi:hypothetical protein
MRWMPAADVSAARMPRRKGVDEFGEVDGGFASGLDVVTGFETVLAVFLGFIAAYIGAAGLIFRLFRLLLLDCGRHLGEIRCPSDSLGVSLGVGAGVLALTTRSPRPRGCTQHPGPSARQRARPA